MQRNKSEQSQLVKNNLNKSYYVWFFGLEDSTSEKCELYIKKQEKEGWGNMVAMKGTCAFLVFS